MEELEFLDDKIHEECGVFGIYNNDDIDTVHMTYLGLFALQHRGQISCGIAVTNGGEVDSYKDLGTVPEAFSKETLEKLTVNGNGKMAVGHVRYSPGQYAQAVNSQPLVMRYIKGTMCLANNGSLVNALSLRHELEHDGAIFQSNSDVEIIAYLLARHRIAAGSAEKALSAIMPKLSGAYTMVITTPHKMIAVRDPKGFRPLCLGKLDNSYIVCSETCALDSIGAEFIRDIEPGEIVVITDEGVKSIREHCGQETSLCIFEHIYFARPDSVIDNVSVHGARQKAGELLAKLHPVEADIVIGVPDSGLDAALGYSKGSGIPYGLGFVKNRYIGRTFIQKSQKERERSVHIKLNPLSSAVKGKRVVLVDDSIVRGTTSAHIVELLRRAGATEVHMRISSPPFLNPCYFGTDISSREYLIACRMSIPEIGAQIGADSLGYLSVDSLREIAKGSKCEFCDGCFTGNYPVPVEEAARDTFDKKLPL